MPTKVDYDLLVEGGRVVRSPVIIDYGAVGVRDGRIAFVGPRSRLPKRFEASENLDAHGGWIVPGLIDLHLHGAGGYDVATDLGGVSRALASRGITSFMPTLVPGPQLLDDVARLAAQLGGGLPGARPLGLHVEGPCLSAHQPGCLDPGHFMLPDDPCLGDLLNAGRSSIRRMTLAVELPGSEALLSRLASRGIAPSLGHTVASFEQVLAAVPLGLRQATHTFNAMAAIHHRDPGPVTAILLCDEIVAEVIADGVHVHPAAIELLYRAKGSDRLMLVSDAVPFAGLDGGRLEWCGQELVVANGVCRTAAGALAGSATLLDGALRVVTSRTTIPLPQVVAMASLVPAGAAGVDTSIGSLEVGKDADIAIFDRDWRCLATVISGRLVYGLSVDCS